LKEHLASGALSFYKEAFDTLNDSTILVHFQKLKYSISKQKDLIKTIVYRALLIKTIV